LTFGKVYVWPLQRHDLATSEARFAAEQRDQVRGLTVRPRRFHDPPELIEVIEASCRTLWNRQQLHRTRKCIDPTPEIETLWAEQPILLFLLTPDRSVWFPDVIR
jgi:hypothetical protein